MRVIVLALVVAAGVMGCAEDVDSTDVRTSGVYADFEALATGNGSTEVSAELRVGGARSNTYMRLVGDDTLTASSAGVAKELGTRSFGDRWWYEVDFDGEEDATFAIRFDRGDEDEGAPNSEARLPPPFVLSGFASGGDISRASGVTFTWEAAETKDFEVRWRVNGDCLLPDSGTISGDGELFLGDRKFTLREDADDTCDGEIHIERVREGSVDPAFGEGGEFEAIQRRTVTFRSVP